MLVYLSRLAHSPPFNPALGLRSAERGDLGVLTWQRQRTSAFYRMSGVILC